MSANTKGTTKQRKGREADADYTKPKGSSAELDCRIAGERRGIEARADWIVLRKNDRPSAEMFFISYFVKKEQDRPITFVFNGGPGASSVYLHMGAVGPKRVRFDTRGEPLGAPHRLTDNHETWLAFTDLVFIDPVGTGFSRIVEAEHKPHDAAASTQEPPKPAPASERTEYYQLKRDLESLSEFMQKFLSRYHRWESAVYIAGESYGGYRVGRLVKMAQASYGIGIKGAILISPALELSLLDGSDYDVLPWIDTFPTMAAAAHYHHKARGVGGDESGKAFADRAAHYALKELLPVLAAGDLYPARQRKRVFDKAADFLGLERATLARHSGRIDSAYFVKNLLRDQNRHLGLYDATLTVHDPYPNRDTYSGPDPTLESVEAAFSAGINTQLRKHLGLKTDRDYQLLSYQVNTAWKIDIRNHAFESQFGATDDLRYGMSLNPHMQVYICNGIYDLVTPYFATDRLSNLMKLDAQRKRNLTVTHYSGGHMFYTWNESREAFFADMQRFYRTASMSQ